ncbi:MAG: hypothetical protein H6825_03395 [Planctomycetes bacterium]|nr:hypothetical protein [Planctomycetota bacterium]
MRNLLSIAAVALLLAGCGSPVQADQAATIATPECAAEGHCSAEMKAKCEAGGECTAEQKAECAEKKACCAEGKADT